PGDTRRAGSARASGRCGSRARSCECSDRPVEHRAAAEDAEGRLLLADAVDEIGGGEPGRGRRAEAALEHRALLRRGRAAQEAGDRVLPERARLRPFPFQHEVQRVELLHAVQAYAVEVEQSRRALLVEHEVPGMEIAMGEAEMIIARAEERFDAAAHARRGLLAVETGEHREAGAHL